MEEIKSVIEPIIIPNNDSKNNSIITIQTKIASAGQVDAGKSSTIGVLISGELDDGRGKARASITSYEHEKISGQTSQISFNYIKDEVKDEKTGLINRKIVTMVDLCGHEKYLRTTLFGLTGLFVDYGMLVIAPNATIPKMTREHLGILLHLKVPFYIIITKLDICSEDHHIYKQTKESIRKIRKAPIINRIPVFLEEPTDSDLEKYTTIMSTSDHVVPIISISNKTGKNIPFLRKFVVGLKPRPKLFNKIDKSIFYIDRSFNVPGIGLVLSGTLRGETITIGQTLYIGPLEGELIPFKIKSMHNNIKEHVTQLLHGDTGCIAVRFMKKDSLMRHQIRKGMVIVSDESFKSSITDTFTAKVKILHHSTSISHKYQAVIHCGSVRQASQIIIEKDKLLRTGNIDVVGFRFLYPREYLEPGTRFFFREGTTRGVGEVLEIGYDPDKHKCEIPKIDPKVDLKVESKIEPKEVPNVEPKVPNVEPKVPNVVPKVEP